MSLNSQQAMKQLLVISVFMFCVSLAHGQSGRKIDIEFQGINDSVLYLVHYYGNSNTLADTAFRERSGRYSFQGRALLPEGVYILVDESKSRSYLEFLIGDNQRFRIKTDTADIYGNLSFSRSPMNTQFREYTQYVVAQRNKANEIRVRRDYIIDSGEEEIHQEKIRELEAKLEKIDEEVRGRQQEVIDRDPNSMVAVLLRLQLEPQHPFDLKNGTREDTINAYRYTRDHFWDAVDLTDERNVRTPLFHQKLNNYLSGMVVQHPDSIILYGEKLIAKTVSAPDLFRFVVWHTINMTERSNVMGMDKAFVHFASEYYLSGKAWWISDAVKNRVAERVRRLERILIGAVAPELQMWDTNRVTTSLHRTQAEYLILYFWDYDCGHCRRITPELRDFYHEMREYGVEVFAVCTKTDLDKWKEHIVKYELDWINVNGGYSINRYDTLYDIMATPIIFLLDRDKKILAKRLDVRQLRNFITQDIEQRRNRDGVKRED